MKMADPFSENELMKIILSAPARRQPPAEQPAAYAEASASASSSATGMMVNRSAFEPFVGGTRRFQKEECSTSSMNKRMTEFLRRDWSRRLELREPERQRSIRHMMNERMRRERERQSFSDLRSMLPHGTRNEKVSIVEAAATEIRNLERHKEELERRNSNLIELTTREGRGEDEDEDEDGGGRGRAKMKVRVENPTSGIDSLMEVLKSLKHMGLSIRSIGSQFTKHEFSTVVEIDSEVEVGDVEAVVQRTLAEVDKWLLIEQSYTQGGKLN